MPAARAVARELADNTSGVSVALCRQMLWKMAGADHPMEAHKVDSRGIRYMGANADAREGIDSFLDKRPAKFAMKPRADMPARYPFCKERTFESAPHVPPDESPHDGNPAPTPPLTRQPTIGFTT